MGEDYVGRVVYTLDGFTRGKVISVARTLGGEISHVNVELDEPNKDGETRVRWYWAECKLA